MPDMRDAIAQYLAFTGGQGFQQPRPGIPSNLQGYPQLPSGQFLPTPISDTGPFPNIPGTQQVPPSTDPNMQPTNAPPMPRPGTPDADFTPSPRPPPVDTPMQAPWEPQGPLPPPPPLVPNPSYGMDPLEQYRSFRR